MKATLVLLLFVCLVLVDVSFCDDNGNIDSPLISSAGYAKSGKKCERVESEIFKDRCLYKCKGAIFGAEIEKDGTPCKFAGYQGKCVNSFCVLEGSRISARSLEPTEESAEPTEEPPIPAEEIPDRVTYLPENGSLP